MLPKEKAEELILKYLRLQEQNYNWFHKELAKKCALIAIDEIIEQWEYIDTYIANGQGQLNPNRIYWYDVKKFVKEL